MLNRPLMSNSELSRSIREKKKKMKEASPDFIDTSPTPDMNAQDIYEIDKDAQVEDDLDSPERINADETALNEPAPAQTMSKENMKSDVQPSDHGKMAYGGEVTEHSDPSMPSMEMQEELGGTSSSRGEMAQRIGDSFEAGSKTMGSESMDKVEDIGGVSDTDGEMKRRIMNRKMRLAGYLDSLG
jgi:hypothetical protein